MKLARHHPEEFRGACGLHNNDGWVKPKDRLETTPEDALAYLEYPSVYERNSSPAQLAAALQESINNPQKIADGDKAPEILDEVIVDPRNTARILGCHKPNTATIYKKSLSL